MPYDYQAEKPKILTDKGQKAFLEVRDKANALCASAGCFRMDKVTPSGDSWTAMAYVDRMVELGEIREITGPGTPGQHRIFVSRREK